MDILHALIPLRTFARKSSNIENFLEFLLQLDNKLHLSENSEIRRVQVDMALITVSLKILRMNRWRLRFRVIFYLSG